MTARLFVLYPPPKDSQAFDRAYRTEHLPLAGPKLKGATRVTTKRVVGPASAPPPYHLMSEITFPDVDAMKADDLLTKVTGLRAASFEDKPNPSLKSPALIVTVTYGENKQEIVTFARSGTDVFASRADEPGTAKVEGPGLDDVMKAIDAVK